MIFSSIQYLIFLPLVVFAYWRTKGVARLCVVVAASYLFYMSWMPLYGALLLLMTLLNWSLALGIEKSGKLTARLLLLVGLTINLGALCYYKYANFVFENIAAVLHFLGQGIFAKLLSEAARSQLAGFDAPVLNVILPLGISFFVFEFAHYLVDVYKGDRAVKSFLQFAAFAAFFPSQIAGPIKRYQDFLAKLTRPEPLSKPLFYEGTSLIVQGLFKKVAIADPLGALVAAPFAASQALSASDAWIASIGFTLQIYLDFSGYTDMGRGSAILLGIRLPENFQLPLLSTDLNLFWRKWHMSLGTWLRDYVYIPLGGSHCSKLGNFKNIFVTMFVSGVWHGASWHYILWGVMHGLGMIAHRIWCDCLEALGLRKKDSQDGALGIIFGTTLTFAYVVFCFDLFRAPDLPHALNIWSSLINFQGVCTLAMPLAKSGVVPIALAYWFFWQICQHLRDNKTIFDRLVKAQNGMFCQPARLASWTAAAILMVAAKPLEAVPFVYFQF